MFISTITHFVAEFACIDDYIPLYKNVIIRRRPVYLICLSLLFKLAYREQNMLRIVHVRKGLPHFIPAHKNGMKILISYRTKKAHEFTKCPIHTG